MTLLLFCLLLLIFGVVLNLYSVPAEPFIYSMELCLLSGAIFLVFGFIRFCRRSHKRSSLIGVIEHAYEELPKAESLMENDYQAMVTSLIRKVGELETSLKSQRQDSLDYYAAWVHQIKTPIAAMQLMLQSEDTEEHRDMAQELFRIEQYVDMVLNYSRLGSDTNDLVIRRLSLDDVIRRSIRKYAPQFIQRKIRLHYEGTDLTVISDEKWLCFIIEQLLSNALKYTLEGEIRIQVSPDEVLSIQDSGIGIAPEDLPRIFEKGYTGYNGRSDHKSTGLGLYLCRKAAHLLGIRLTASSTPGEGSCFCIDLKKKELDVNS